MKNITLTNIKMICPRCKSRLLFDSPDIYCLACGWRKHQVIKPDIDTENIQPAGDPRGEPGSSVPVPGPELTYQEFRILTMWAHGFKNKEICESLNITINTIYFHYKNIKSKLKAKTDMHALYLAIQSGLITLDKESN
jgi:DNA-binding NarL/FixJ family response regulator